MELKANQKKALSDVLFILWAGGAALLSYSLVYALRKPFTAATFDGLDFFGMDYKTATSIVQIAGYFLSKLIGIKVISEMKKENRLKFIIASVAVAELSLVLFGALPRPYNVFALFFNGLSLGCMWGVIFSFLEGRRVTDLLARLMGVSIASRTCPTRRCSMWATACAFGTTTVMSANSGCPRSSVRLLSRCFLCWDGR